jgi:hypothetical protein
MNLSMVGIAAQRARTTDQGDEARLVELFRNRAALKKEFAQLRRENYRLKEIIHDHENSKAGVQQQLEQLESLLSEPLQAANASVFFQLRGIWDLCHKRLSRLAEELVANQRDREQKALLDKFESARRDSVDKIDSHIAKAEFRLQEIDDKREENRKGQDQLRGFWNHFKRRALRSEADQSEQDFTEVSAKLDRFKLARDTKMGEKGPQFESLTVDGQRKINLALIAIAQELYIHFKPRHISSMSRESSVRKVADANYGGLEECRQMNKYIDDRIQALKAGQEMVINVRNRALYLEKHAHYRSDTDLVPVASSFAEIPLIFSDADEPHGKKAIPVNVLADEYWDIFSALLT